MGTTKKTQKKAKATIDEKLHLSIPSRDLLESLAVECASKPSQDNTFQYAFALSKSENTRELQYAVSILDGLVKENYEFQIDCMYGAATAFYNLQEYSSARKRCEAILRNYPDHVNTKELHLACIQGEEVLNEKKLKRAAIEGTVGVAAIGLALSVAGLMLGRKR
mmetsp:Transcript_140/g.224  ORF Transcript_140/g.224 Transcript_140/m.224 type:complete len:165 (-) Transcript_140:243-737(-)